MLKRDGIGDGIVKGMLVVVQDGSIPQIIDLSCATSTLTGLSYGVDVQHLVHLLMFGHT
jgi:hypothetical protein